MLILQCLLGYWMQMAKQMQSLLHPLVGNSLQSTTQLVVQVRPGAGSVKELGHGGISHSHSVAKSSLPILRNTQTHYLSHFEVLVSACTTACPSSTWLGPRGGGWGQTLTRCSQCKPM